MKVKRALAVLFLTLLADVAAVAERDPPLRLRQTISLPGVEGRIDHMTFDAANQRLFVCALGNNTVEVVDLIKGERVRSIANLGAPQGTAYVPEFNRLFVANDNGGLLKIFDAQSFQPMAELSFQDDADNIRYDSVGKKIYAGFGSGGISIVSAPDGKQIGTIKLTAHPEAFVLETNGKRIFVNVPNSRCVAVVDRDKGDVVAKWSTGFAFGNFPMALDEGHHRLFVGCRLPSTLVVFDTNSGSVVAKIGLCGDSDDLFYDEKRHCIYATCGSGEINVIEQATADTYNLVAKIETAVGARTGLFVPEQNTLFVAVPHRGTQSAEIRCYQAR